MIKDILAAFRAPAPRSLATDDARLALTALLVRVARADADYAQVEQETILNLLQERYDLSRAQALKLREQAEELEAQAPDTVRFTRTVKDAVPYEERESVIEALWSVVLTDNRRDHEEDAFMRLVVSLLGVTDRDSGHARQTAQAKLGK